MLHDFGENYRAFERWNQDQRYKSLKAKLNSLVSRTFQAVKDSFRAPLETLVDKIEAPVQRINPVDCSVEVDIDIQDKSILHWTLDDQPVRVAPGDGCLRVDSGCMLRPGQRLACHCLIADVEDILYIGAYDLWLPIWNKLVNTPAAQWDRIIAFADAYLPRVLEEAVSCLR